MMHEPTNKPWTPESLAAHRARLEIIDKLGYGPSSIAGPDWIVGKVKMDLADLQAQLDAALLQIREYQAAVRKCDNCCACLTFDDRWKGLDRGSKDTEKPICDCGDPKCYKFYDHGKA